MVVLRYCVPVWRESMPGPVEDRMLGDGIEP